MMTATEKKVKKSCGTVDNCFSSGVFVHTDGTITDCSTKTHEFTCKQAGVTLFAYLKAGGYRVKLFGKTIAIEAARLPTEKQIDTIGRILRQGEFYLLITSVNGNYQEITKFDRKITVADFMRLIEG